MISKFLFSINFIKNNFKRIVKALLKFDRVKKIKVFEFYDSSPIEIDKGGYIKVIIIFFLSVAVKGQNKVLNNEKIRIGRGAENSINVIGNMQQPFYFNEKSNSWRQLTFGKNPLDIVWGIGNDGTNNWNYNGRLVENPGILNYNINYDNFIITNSTTGQGYGKIVFSGNLVVDNKNFRIENTYTLEENAAYIKAKIKVTNASGQKASNIRLWIGTKDDFVGKSDSPNKERGNIVNGNFVVNTSALDQAKAIKISTDDEAVLFYSNSDRAHTSIGSCCYFFNAVKQDPKTSNTVINGRDSSYALYVRFNDLENNQSDELELYYAAGTLAKINEIIAEVSNAAASVKNILCESANYDYSFEKTGITSYLVIPSAAIAPTELQIEEGIDYNNEFKIISKGKIATSANEKHTFNFRSLNENTAYTVYAVTKFNDGSSDIFSPISKVNFTTKEKPIKPSGNDKQEFLVSHLTDAKISSLYTVQRGTEWYASADDASSRFNELEDKTILINGKKYYGIQYDGTCLSDIFEVTVKVSTFTQIILEQIGNEADIPNVIKSNITVNQITSIDPFISNVKFSNENLYQEFIDSNPNLFSNPATVSEVQDMVNVVNQSQNILNQIGSEADKPNIVNSVVTVAQINTISPAVTGVNPSYETLYQDYIDANPNLFSSPAVVLEVQSAINIVNKSQRVLIQIGNEGDDPNRINSAVTVGQINNINPTITEVETAYEIHYQAYIDTNPNLFSVPATIFEVQSMVNLVNASQSVLYQIGREADTPDIINAVITVVQINKISPTIIGTDPNKEVFYQDHIDANPNLFSNPATAQEVQTMINMLIIDNDEDGIPDFYDLDDDNDGIIDSNEDKEDSNRDTDRDGILDRFDLDSDGDGILDLVESGQNSALVDRNGDGILDSTIDADYDGLLDIVDEDYTNSFTGAKGVVIPDGSDNDNIPDFQDLDSDNDGISDLIEGGIDLNLDKDNNGMIDERFDYNNNGVIDVVDSVRGGEVASIPDTDNDGIPDFQDIDSDSDGAYDVEEVGGVDSDNDGRIDVNELKSLLDSDNDNIPNFQDVDDDEDGILTLDEDINKDGILNNDDTDMDDVPNYLDPDDDGDGVLTNNENIGDCDFDGLPDYLDITDCNVAPEGFSPNNDKVNDEFVIPFLLKYPNFSIEIYSRSGRKTYVYENKGREKPIWWNGYANASLIFYGSNPVPVGPYYYLIKLNDGSKKEYEGWVYINR